LEEFVKVNSLTESEWKEIKTGQFYFDCSKYNKDFKVDPEKL